MHKTNICEIGSEFWLDSSPDKSCEIPSWLQKKGSVHLFSSGRGAIRAILDCVIKEGYRHAVLPSYLCEAMITPFEKMGFRIDYYSLNTSLECNIDEIKSLCLRGTSVLLHMGYFGFETNAELKSVIEELKNDNIIIVEDITHTIFSDFPINSSHFSVASLRKWIGIPSGGAVFANSGKKIVDGSEIQKKLVDIRYEALMLKGKYINGGNVSYRKKYLELFSKGEKILDDDIGVYSIDPYSVGILKKLNQKNLKSNRRRNFQFLLDNVSLLKNATPVFKTFPADVCPLFYPFFVNEERDNIKKTLVQNNIYCTSHWPLSNKLDGRFSDDCNYLYNNMISIPCDQRYNLENMNYIIELLVKTLK